MELKDLKGLGKVRLEALNKAGILTLTDLLMTLPRGYRDTSVITPLSEIKEGEPCCVSGFLKSAPKLAHFRGINRVTATLCDETGKLPLEELMQNFEKGSKLVKLCRKKLEALECKIELLTKDDGNSGEWQEFHGEESNLRNAPSPLEDAPF